MDRKRVIFLSTAEETKLFASEFAHTLTPNTILALQGDLGAGKTTFVQGLAQGLAINELVQSPTFTYLQIYEEGTLPLYHFDLYRLKNERDFTPLGFEEYFDAGGIVVIEWPGRIPSLIPASAQLITLSYERSGRVATVQSWGER